MNDLRTAAQQALEFLDEEFGWSPGEAPRIDALRAALAQEQAEPICKCDLRTRLVGDGCEVCNPKLAAQFAQEQAEPVQEPVGHEALRLAGLALIGLAEHDQYCEVFDVDDEGRHKACTCGLVAAIAVITQAGKTAPPQRKPLTDEEIMDAFHAARNAKLGASQDNSKHRLSVVEIARAVERAHGIGEGA